MSDSARKAFSLTKQSNSIKNEIASLCKLRSQIHYHLLFYHYQKTKLVVRIIRRSGDFSALLLLKGTLLQFRIFAWVGVHRTNLDRKTLLDKRNLSQRADSHRFGAPDTHFSLKYEYPTIVIVCHMPCQNSDRIRAESVHG